MKWQPIETYDALKKKPRLALFLFAAVNESRQKLPQHIEMDRCFGRRTCTHWCEIPEPPK